MQKGSLGVSGCIWQRRGQCYEYLEVLATSLGAPVISVGAPAPSLSTWTTSLEVQGTSLGVLAESLRLPVTSQGALVTSLGVPATSLRAPYITVEQSVQNYILTGNAAGVPGYHSYC